MRRMVVRHDVEDVRLLLLGERRRAEDDGHEKRGRPEREQPAGVDLSGDKTDFFNVSYDILCRTGTQAENNWINHGSPSGPEFDKVRGMSPYTEWIWTINGAGHNVLEIGDQGDHPEAYIKVSIFTQRIEELEAENERYRKALESIATDRMPGWGTRVLDTAKRALSGGE